MLEPGGVNKRHLVVFAVGEAGGSDDGDEHLVDIRVGHMHRHEINRLQAVVLAVDGIGSSRRGGGQAATGG